MPSGIARVAERSRCESSAAGALAPSVTKLPASVPTALPTSVPTALPTAVLLYSEAPAAVLLSSEVLAFSVLLSPETPAAAQLSAEVVRWRERGLREPRECRCLTCVEWHCGLHRARPMRAECG